LFMGKIATPCLLPFTRKGLPPALIHDDLKTLDVQVRGTWDKCDACV